MEPTVSTAGFGREVQAPPYFARSGRPARARGRASLPGALELEFDQGHGVGLTVGLGRRLLALQVPGAGEMKDRLRGGVHRAAIPGASRWPRPCPRIREWVVPATCAAVEPSVSVGRPRCP